MISAQKAKHLDVTTMFTYLHANTPSQSEHAYYLSYFIQSTLSKTDTFGTGTSCPSYRESNRGRKERQGPTLGVRFTEVSVKRESTVIIITVISCYMGLYRNLSQGAKKVIFTACHSGKLKPTFTSPDVISTSPPNFL